MTDRRSDESRVEHLFSLTHANRWPTMDRILRKNEVVTFAGQGVVEGVFETDLADETKLPKRVAKVMTDRLELNPKCRHCGKPL